MSDENKEKMDDVRKTADKEHLKFYGTLVPN